MTEVNRINYRLRSTFFYRKLREYNTLSLRAKIEALLPIQNLYDWDNKLDWGIGEDAFNYVNQHPNLQFIQVFCHPRLIREQPQLIAYYRNVAVLSQKAVISLIGIQVKRFESDEENKFQLAEDNALELAKLFNEHISLIIDSSVNSITEEELYGLILASTGTQIDGSWRNAIGEEAEKLVQRLLIKEAKEQSLIAAFIPRKATVVDMYNPNNSEEQIENIEKYRGLMLNNQTSILFSSEPDISLLDNGGKTVGVIEVKGGTDTAGALERYGAAIKSFEEARRRNSEVRTILVASCITTEVNTRIQNDRIVSCYFNLTEILSDNSEQYKQFVEEVFSIL
ncbi:XcyI family restriction endonuclease [Brunnivagina elsteri]|uniref:XcyI family restriction endonuclease n=1 Tax=Brunnivagina elsteri TaxID=1247191 RepID=UPI0013040FB9|nr:XcyI family restriction endonuclease [Calothrix elsteri]